MRLLAGGLVAQTGTRGGVLDEAAAALTRAINERDWTTVVTRCPVRESPALDTIAKGIGLKGRLDYEKAVRQLVIDEEEALTFARSLFAEAFGQISAAG